MATPTSASTRSVPSRPIGRGRSLLVPTVRRAMPTTTGPASKGSFIQMHLSMLHQMIEALGIQMRQKRSGDLSGDGAASHAKTLLWFAANSIRELQADMPSYMLEKHSHVDEDANAAGPMEHGGARAATPSPPRTPPRRHPPRARRKSAHLSVPAVDDGPPMMRQRSLTTPNRSFSLSRQSRSSFDSSAIASASQEAAEPWGHFEKKRRQRASRCSRYGAGAATLGHPSGQSRSVNHFQMLFLLRYKQARNQGGEGAGAAWDALNRLVTSHCDWALGSASLPFRRIVDAFVDKMQSVRCDTQAKGASGAGDDYDMTRAHLRVMKLRERMLDISGFVNTLSAAVWRVHGTLRSRRDPGPMRDMFTRACVRSAWLRVMDAMSTHVLNWYRAVYSNENKSLTAQWAECRRGAAQMAGRHASAREASLDRALSPVIQIVQGDAFTSDHLMDKVDAATALIRTVPLVLPRGLAATADAALSVIAYCLVRGAGSGVSLCSNLHFLSDLYVLVYADDAMGETGCAVTSLMCAAQYASGLDVHGYVDLLQTLSPDIDDTAPPDRAHATMPLVEPMEAQDSALVGAAATRSSPHGSPGSRSNTPRSRSKSVSSGGVTSALAGPEVDGKSGRSGGSDDAWAHGDPDLVAICQHVVKTVATREKRTTSKTPKSRAVFTARAIVKRLEDAGICASKQGAIRLARLCADRCMIMPYKPESTAATSASDPSIAVSSGATHAEFTADDTVWVAGRFIDANSLKQSPQEAGLTTRATGRMESIFEYEPKTLAAMWRRRRAMLDKEENKISPLDAKMRGKLPDNASCPALVEASAASCQEPGAPRTAATTANQGGRMWS